jgi:hypothetical protein
LKNSKYSNNLSSKFSEDEIIEGIKNGTIHKYAPFTQKYLKKGILKEIQTDDSSTVLSLTNKIFTTLVNENGLIIINDTLWQFEPDQIVLYTDGNYLKKNKIDLNTSNRSVIKIKSVPIDELDPEPDPDPNPTPISISLSNTPVSITKNYRKVQIQETYVRVINGLQTHTFGWIEFTCWRHDWSLSNGWVWRLDNLYCTVDGNYTWLHNENNGLLSQKVYFNKYYGHIKSTSYTYILPNDGNDYYGKPYDVKESIWNLKAEGVGLSFNLDYRRYLGFGIY